MKLSVLFLFVINISFAQLRVTGLITDSSGTNPVPYASIGIIGKSVGTLSGANGRFAFYFNEKIKNDTVKISAIGYVPQIFTVSEFFKENTRKIKLEPLAENLDEVVIKSNKIKYCTLGNLSYTKNNCSGFVKNTNNWKGSEAAILAGNKEGRLVQLESFSFFIIQNKYEDSLTFRLMFYEASEKKYPMPKTFVRKPIVFKVGIRQGEFVLDLKEYNLCTSKDFFISLECLMDEMDITKFCYAGSHTTPSYAKPSAFSRWTRVRGGGADFNVKVSYTKK